MATRKTTTKSVKKEKKTSSAVKGDMLYSKNSKEKNIFQKRIIKNKYILVGILIIIIGFLLYYFKGVFVVAMVNGQPISRLALIQELNKQYGKQMLNNLVTQTLIMQEARKQNITVTDQEINSELKKIEDNLSKQGQSLDQALLLQGMTKDDLINNIRTQLTVSKILEKDIKVSDKEINDYISQNKETLPTSQNPDQIRQSVKQQLTQNKLVQKYQSWIANIEKNAKISYF